MARLIKLLIILVITSGILFNANPVLAKRPKHLFKVASLAPGGSVWAKRFQEFTEEVEEKSNGEIGFKIYPGGVMGDDRAMYRKMKIGQLQGGGFTMTGIGEIVKDFRVMGIPFLFNSYEEVDFVKEKLRPQFKKAFREKNLELLAMSEVGFIYTLSKKPISTINDLQKTKSWVPQGDPISNVFLQTVGVTPTSLSIPDVLTSLQTGLIDTAYNSFYGAIVLQWFTRTKYVTDIPFTYGYGAFAVDMKTFSKLPPAYAELMESTAKTYFARLLQDTRDSNNSALQALKKNGITVVRAAPGITEKLQHYREITVEKIIDDAFSKEIYDATIKSLYDFRGKKEPLLKK